MANFAFLNFFFHFSLCSIILTLFWDFFYKEYFVVAATKYMCIADLVKSKNEFPQRCNKKAVLFSHSAWFCLFIIIFSLHQNIYVVPMYFCFLEIIFNAHSTLHFRNATIVIYAKFAAIHCFFPISFIFEKNS